MIDKKSLMVGNLVVLAHESNAPIAEIVELHKKYAVVRIWPTQLEHRPIYKYILPVELSEYWLERLGFEKKYDGDGEMYWVYDYLELYFYEFFNESENGFYHIWNRPEELKIGSVHQLMNLYHGLSGGKELMFNKVNENNQSV